jgi:type IV secretory pathway VirB2 component (pilin)
MLSRARALVILGVLLLALAVPAAAQQNVSPQQALTPIQQLLVGLIQWFLGPGRLIIALAWLVVGFKIVLGMEHRGAGAFIFVAIIGLLIVFAPQILAALGIDINQYIGATRA